MVWIFLRMKGMNEKSFALYFIPKGKKKKNYSGRAWNSLQGAYSLGHTLTDGETEVKCHVKGHPAAI